MSKVYDLVGQRFGRLVVLEKEKQDIPNTKRTCVWWRCECDCGNIVIVPTTRLVTGVTKSCGCYKAYASAKKTDNAWAWTRRALVWRMEYNETALLLCWLSKLCKLWS